MGSGTVAEEVGHDAHKRYSHMTFAAHRAVTVRVQKNAD